MCVRLWSGSHLHCQPADRLLGSSKPSPTSNLFCDQLFTKKDLSMQDQTLSGHFGGKIKNLILGCFLGTFPAQPPPSGKEPSRCPGLRVMPWQFQKSVSMCGPCAGHNITEDPMPTGRKEEAGSSWLSLPCPHYISVPCRCPEFSADIGSNAVNVCSAQRRCPSHLCATNHFPLKGFWCTTEADRYKILPTQLGQSYFRAEP